MMQNRDEQHDEDLIDLGAASVETLGGSDTGTEPVNKHQIGISED